MSENISLRSYTSYQRRFPLSAAKTLHRLVTENEQMLADEGRDGTLRRYRNLLKALRNFKRIRDTVTIEASIITDKLTDNAIGIATILANRVIILDDDHTRQVRGDNLDFWVSNGYRSAVQTVAKTLLDTHSKYTMERSAFVIQDAEPRDPTYSNAWSELMPTVATHSVISLPGDEPDISGLTNESKPSRIFYTN